MTNINCTKKCIFQKDGVCSYDNTANIIKRLEGKGEANICIYLQTDKKLKND